MRRTKIYYIEEKDCVTITGFENVARRSALPKAYFSEKPYYYYDGDGEMIVFVHKSGNGVRTDYIFKGCVYSKDYFFKIIEDMKKAGERLTKLLHSKVVEI